MHWLKLDPNVNVHSFWVTALITSAHKQASAVSVLQDFAEHANPRDWHSTSAMLHTSREGFTSKGKVGAAMETGGALSVDVMDRMALASTAPMPCMSTAGCAVKGVNPTGVPTGGSDFRRLLI